MPANLPPQYLEAEKRFREARTPQEKIEALKQMLALIPKHKGTEKLQAEIKRKIARFKNELQKKSKHEKRGFFYSVEKEGAGQVVVIGPPNVGKSQLVATLTRALPQIADYPFTTRIPQPGMMPYENVQIQLVDLPPIAPDYTENWVFGIIRTADAALLLVDLGSEEVLDQIETTLEQLKNRKIYLVTELPSNLSDPSMAYKRALLVGNKLDLPGAPECLEVLKELYGQKFPVLGISAKEGQYLDELKERVFRMLKIVRVYSKPPGKEADRSRPFVFKEGSNLLDFAEAIHQDFAERLKYARVWGPEKFDGQRVNRDYILMDGDVIELHI